MKKVLIGVLAIIMVLGIVGCSSTPATEKTSTPQPTEEATQTPEATVEPTSTETSSSWEIDYYVDDFGDKTDEPYMKGVFPGNFSITATNNSELTVVVGYDYYIPEVQTNMNPSQYYMSFRLLEYDNHIATFSERDEITLKVKIDDNIIEYNLVGNAPNGDLLIKEKEEFYHELPILTTALKGNKNEIPCVIEIGSSKYLFKMDGDGFLEQRNKLDEIKTELGLSMPHDYHIIN